MRLSSRTWVQQHMQLSEKFTLFLRPTSNPTSWTKTFFYHEHKLSHEDRDQHVEELLDHVRHLRGVIDVVQRRAREVARELEPVEHGYDDAVRVQDHHCSLQDEQVLVVAKLPKHEIAVVHDLTANREAIADP